jgi:hypothetical protein
VARIEASPVLQLQRCTAFSMSPRDLMPQTTNIGDDWDDAHKSEIVACIVAGTLSIRHACDRYGLSPERIRDWVMLSPRTIQPENISATSASKLLRLS